jgi:hypothetical protein
VQQLSSQATAAASAAAASASAAAASALSPFDVFGGSVWLNLLFFASLGLLSYSLLVLSPRQ